TDENGNTTQFAYDDLGRQVSQRDALGGLQLYGYDLNSNLVSMSDELNRTTRLAYDQRDRLISRTNPLNNAMAFQYDAVGNMLQMRDELNHSTSYTYDALNRLLNRTDANHGVMTYGYDAVDNLVKVTDELNRISTLSYDELDRRVIATDPLGHTATATYDAVGNTLQTSDPLGHGTRVNYDALDRVTQQTDALGGVTRFTYDAVGNLLSLTDPVNNTTQYAYDALNRTTKETDPIGKIRTYSYDPVGNLKSMTDRNNRVRKFDNDALNRRTAEKWLDPTGTSTRTFGYAFDAASQLSSTSDPASSYVYQYDEDGRQTSMSNVGTPGVPAVVFSYAYDAADNLARRRDSIGGVDRGLNSYAYDTLNRMTRVTQSGTGVTDKRVDMSYDAASQMTGLTRFADLIGTQLVASSKYNYDAAGRLTGLAHVHSATSLATYTWTYDAANRITQATSPDGTSSYSYDTTNQLTATDHSFQNDEAYSYDLNGNRTNRGYQADLNNRIRSDGTFNYAYDAEGNRTKRTNIASGEVTDYEWDYRNRLIRVRTKPNDQGPVTKDVIYTYDVFDRRIAKSVDADGPGSAPAKIERFVYDGVHIALSFDGTGTPIHRYLHGPMVDQILADENALGQILWSMTDNQGTVRDLVDSSGTVRNHITFDSFGRLADQTNATIDFLFAYTGREFDRETGLYYYRARYYDSQSGRFLSEDPLGFMGDLSNLSRYVGNNVSNKQDPSGLLTGIEFVIVTIIVAPVASWAYNGWAEHQREEQRLAEASARETAWRNELANNPQLQTLINNSTGEQRHTLRDKFSKEHEFYNPDEGMTRIPNTATSDYYCHDLPWGKGRAQAGRHVDPNPMVENPEGYGYSEITRNRLRSGDIVTYANSNPNKPDHSSRVERIDPDGTIWMRSKDVDNSEFIHRLGNDGDRNFFRDRYGLLPLRFFRQIHPAQPLVDSLVHGLIQLRK
ncbi:MAG TPA: RHS repeat-associated core domain-containing protein, partial [Pirellula sp.]|nr:RHS repeat-associated core domain-containing protein [Pirellula sp.]